MGSSTETTLNIAAGPPHEVHYLVAHVRITSPTQNAKLGSSFIITGTASCKHLMDKPGDENGIFVRDATDSITGVDVRVGDTNPVQRATPTGSGTTPWATWSFAANTTVRGPLTITAWVSASSGIGDDTDTDATAVIIDITPPTLIPHLPADVTKSAPPYTATIMGTATDDATGVAAVEWRLGASGAFQAATGTTNWSKVVELPPELGTHTVTLRARDNAGNVSPEQNVTVTVKDATPPALNITTPREGETFTLAAGGRNR